MSESLEACLHDLERRLDAAQEEANRSAWQAFLDNKHTTGYFIAPPRRPVPASLNWPSININDAINDPELMVLRELKGVSEVLAKGSGERLNVRCNHSTGILPSLFGCEVFMMPRETDTLPAARPLETRDAIKALLDGGMPNLNHGLARNVFECAELFLECFRSHPTLARDITLFHPDAQGPIDAAEVIWGSDIFLALYDEPETLGSLLELIVRTYTAFMHKWFALVPGEAGQCTHWGLALKGRIVLRNDSLMNLPPQMYIDYVRKHDQVLLDEFGGGMIHFCGRGDHYIAALAGLHGLTAINLSQPHLNNMETIFSNTIDKGIKILGLDRAAAEKALSQGRNLRGQVHCW